MRHLPALGLVALGLAGSAVAQVPVGLVHIPGDSLTAIPIAEWEVPGRDVDGPQVARIRIAEG